MLIISKRIAAQPTHDAELVLPFELRQKSRLRTVLANGEEVGLFLDRGHILRDGEYLQADDGRIVIVRAKPERVMRISCISERDLIRIAYHLGNRHVPLQVAGGWLSITNDDVLRKMVEGLGASVELLQVPFEPEAGAYGGHHHGSESTGHQGLIHHFGRKQLQGNGA